MRHRWMALVLAAALALSALPGAALADDRDEPVLVAEGETVQAERLALAQQTTTAQPEKIWKYLLQKLGNPYGAAGLMGNLYAESALVANNLQNSYERSLGYSDAAYTDAVDNGTYNNFVYDSAGYGLAQWTYYSRKKNLLDFARAGNASIGNLDMQLDFLWKELTGSYPGVVNTLRYAASVREASDAVLTRFERPADQGESAKQRRASYGQTYFDRYVDMQTITRYTVYLDVGETSYVGVTAGRSSDEKVAYLDREGNIVAAGPGSAVIAVAGGNTIILYHVTVAGELPEEQELHFPRMLTYTEGQFTDVYTGLWYAKNVADAYELGLMNGRGLDTFEPNGNVTIAEAITMAARIYSIYTGDGETFARYGNWYQVYLDYAYRNGIISGAYYTGNVNREATRAQFAEIFAMSLPEEGLAVIREIPDDAIPDVKTTDACAPYVYRLYRAGILNGKEGGAFLPEDRIIRAEAAAIVARMADTDNRIQQ